MKGWNALTQIGYCHRVNTHRYIHKTPRWIGSALGLEMGLSSGEINSLATEDFEAVSLREYSSI